MPFHLNPKQEEANLLLGGPAQRILLDGGSRSGKTFLILRAMLTRGFFASCRQVALRYRFSHIKTSLVAQTLPAVMKACFPDAEPHCTLNKSDYYYRLSNGSEIWFGGLDDKERTEKILGNEYVSMFFNECSQIPWSSHNVAITRLAQKVEGLRTRAYYDCNPPQKTHWTYQAFVQGRDPDTGKPMPEEEKAQFVRMKLNPVDNLENIDAGYLKTLEALPERLRRRFLYGEFGDAVEGALWSLEGIDRATIDGELPELSKIVVAVDPSGCSGPEDLRSDEIGIVVAGLCQDGRSIVLEDLSGRFSPNQWARAALDAYYRWAANCVVAEINFGGAMVESTLRAARAADESPIAFRLVTASRGKIARAEPIAQLTDEGKLIFAGRFPKLADQLCGMSMAGYAGGKSPDRADAMVWAIHALFPAIIKSRVKDVEVPGIPKPKPMLIPPGMGRDAWMGTLGR